jgi:hypothetical protein
LLRKMTAEITATAMTTTENPIMAIGRVTASVAAPIPTT